MFHLLISHQPLRCHRITRRVNRLVNVIKVSRLKPFFDEFAFNWIFGGSGRGFAFLFMLVSFGLLINFQNRIKIHFFARWIRAWKVMVLLWTSSIFPTRSWIWAAARAPLDPMRLVQIHCSCRIVAVSCTENYVRKLRIMATVRTSRKIIAQFSLFLTGKWMSSLRLSIKVSWA